MNWKGRGRKIPWLCFQYFFGICLEVVKIPRVSQSMQSISQWKFAPGTTLKQITSFAARGSFPVSLQNM
jgi:hypothetical protein